MDISTAHVIEAARLDENLAILRNYPPPRLEELKEAVMAVIFIGDKTMFKLVRE